jgi:hypothetical protein
VQRLLGWKDERAVDNALRSIELAVNHDAALVLCGDGDLVPIARGLHRRSLGAYRPFVVCQAQRGYGYIPAWARLSAKRRTGVAALEDASGGTLCLRRRPLLRDFSTLVAQLRSTCDVMLIVCASPTASADPLVIRPAPLALPALATRRSDEIDRVIAEYSADACAELCAPPGSFTESDHAWVREHAATLLDEVEMATLRLVAIRASRSVNAAADRLGMPRSSLHCWVERSSGAPGGGRLPGGRLDQHREEGNHVDQG